MTDTPRPDRTLEEIVNRVAGWLKSHAVELRGGPLRSRLADAKGADQMAADLLAALSSVQARTREAVRDEGEQQKEPPGCLKCCERMTRQQNVVMTDEQREGITVTMPWAYVCACGYKTIAGHQMGEFQARVLAAERDAAQARAEKAEAQLARVRRDTLREAAEASRDEFGTLDTARTFTDWLRTRADEQEPREGGR